MRLTKRDKQIKYGVYCLILCLCSVLQNVDGLMVEIGAARCFILLPMAVLLTIDEDEKIASLLGLFAGVLWDINSIHHMGFNAIYIMIACFICSYLSVHMFRNTFMFNMVCSILTSVLYCALYWLIFVLFRGVDGGAWSVLYFYIPCALYTSVSAPIIYAILKPIKRKLNKIYDFQQ